MTRYTWSPTARVVDQSNIGYFHLQLSRWFKFHCSHQQPGAICFFAPGQVWRHWTQDRESVLHVSVAQKPECHSKQRALLELRSIRYPRNRMDSRVPWLELVQNRPLTEKCEQSACWGSSTFPLPMVLWECMQLLKVWCFEWWLTYSTVHCEKKKKVPTPSLKKKKKCRTPTKQAHMYHVQGLSSNIGLNGMPHFQPLCTCLIIAQRFVVVRLRVQLHANDSFVLRHGTFSCRFSSLFVMFRVFMRLISVLVEAEIYSEPSIIVASSDNVILKTKKQIWIERFSKSGYFGVLWFFYFFFFK